ncbi:MAG: hypothetical protein ACI9BD_000294 [Candidatus Marinamargulisbacteria bacterium]|jgi:hypothetical protein
MVNGVDGHNRNEQVPQKMAKVFEELHAINGQLEILGKAFSATLAPVKDVAQVKASLENALVLFAQADTVVDASDAQRFLSETMQFSMRMDMAGRILKLPQVSEAGSFVGVTEPDSVVAALKQCLVQLNSA